MEANERKRRPVLERTKPIRNWTNAVSVGPASSGQQIRQDVQNANRVIEEYMSAGRATAQRFEAASRAASVLGSTEDIAQRVVRAASDSMSLWLEFMARSGGGLVQPQKDAVPPLSTTPNVPAAPAIEGFQVAMEVDSLRPVTVSLDLRSDTRRSELTIGRLHPRDSKATPLKDVEIRAASRGGLTVRLRVEPDQPAGIYHGVMIDERTSLPAGTMSVEIKRRRTTSARKRRR